VKKKYVITIVSFLIILTAGCVTNQRVSLRDKINRLNVQQVCRTDSSSKSISNLLKEAQLYNSVAKADRVEFLRHKISTSKLIKIAYSELKKGDIENAEADARRACVWSIRAIQQEKEPGYRLSEN